MEEFPDLHFIVTFFMEDGTQHRCQVTSPTFTNAIPKAVMQLVRFGQLGMFENPAAVASVLIVRQP
jgi:hypothetical protein